MKIAYLGSGAWGFALANLLAQNGHQVKMWGIEKDVLDYLNEKREHPRFPGIAAHENLHIEYELKGALEGAEMMIESVTTKGLRPVLKTLLDMGGFSIPFVMTSKGIEQGTGNLLPEIALDVLGYTYKEYIGCISGPTIAQEVMHKMPTSAVASSFEPEVMHAIAEVFSNDFFRVYPNADIIGVCFGGAMKNAIAIASGIIDGLEFGQNTKAAMITRGLHEMRKLSRLKGAHPDTIGGLSGLGDLIVTCLSDQSRNYKFGRMLAEGVSPDEAKEKIGMVVEGANTCLSAMELAEKANIPLPITEAVYKVVYKNLDPKEAVKQVLTRTIKEEYL